MDKDSPGDGWLEAAKIVIRRQADVPPDWKKDPLWPALEALVKAGRKYDGSAHLTLAQELAGDGRHAEA